MLFFGEIIFHCIPSHFEGRCGGRLGGAGRDVAPAGRKGRTFPPTHSGEGPGHRSGPTTGVCHSCWLDVALVNGGKPSGSSGLRRSAPLPGRTVRDEIATMRASKGVSAASAVQRSGRTTLRHCYQVAPFRRFISLALSRRPPGRPLTGTRRGLKDGAWPPQPCRRLAVVLRFDAAKVCEPVPR